MIADRRPLSGGFLDAAGGEGNNEAGLSDEMSTRVIHVETEKDAAAAVREGVRALGAGRLVAFATETVYGVAAVATHDKAMGRLRSLKDRPRGPFSVHVGRPEDVGRYVREIPPAAGRLIRRCWPGPVTVLLPVGAKLADRKLQRKGLYERLCANGRIGLRCPDAPVAAEILARVKEPVVAPSANLTGRRSPRTAEEVLSSLDGRIDLLIDCGRTRYGKDSTIVRFSQDDWKLVREGAYTERTIRKLLKLTILFVCTGNTCRSPIAAGLARKMLSDRLHCCVGELRGRGVEVLSAGVSACDGGRAAREAVRAARRFGADISRHRSRGLTRELIHKADMVFCMTDRHAASVRRMVPAAGARTQRLSVETDIADPIGGDADVYLRTAEQIRRALPTALDKRVV